MNMKYAMRSEDTEQINVVSWANWNVNRYGLMLKEALQVMLDALTV